jgi:hypothetical protein
MKYGGLHFARFGGGAAVTTGGIPPVDAVAVMDFALPAGVFLDSVWVAFVTGETLAGWSSVTGTAGSRLVADAADVAAGAGSTGFEGSGPLGFKGAAADAMSVGPGAETPVVAGAATVVGCFAQTSTPRRAAESIPAMLAIIRVFDRRGTPRAVFADGAIVPGDR